MTANVAVRPDNFVREWAARIAAHADLGDERLEARLSVILETTSRLPGGSIPQVCGNKHQSKATYRFLSNKRVTQERLARGVGAATAASCAHAPTIYAVQDTTSINYSNLKRTTGLGPLNDSVSAKGLHVHCTVAVTADGVLLGLLDQHIWARCSGRRTAPSRKNLPIEQKESFKWIRGVRGARQAIAHLLPEERPRLVHVMDREDDVHEVFEEIQESEGFLIRCSQNRNIHAEGDEAIDKAHAAASQSPCRGTMKLTVGKHGERHRHATLEVRAMEVTLAPREPRKHPVTLTLIEAGERDAPADGQPILWRLWTNERAESFEEIVGCIHLYSRRWRIEEFHLTLKSGCGIEELELETAQRLMNAIVVYSAVAIRIVTLRDLGKHKPDTCCTQVLRDIEWRLLVKHFENRQPGPHEPPPTIRMAMRWIGRLGGFLDRKSDGLPGVRTLWRGERSLQLMVMGYRIAVNDR